MMAAASLGTSKSPKLSSQLPTCGDRRLVDKVLKRLDKLYTLTINPRLGLRYSPPFLPDLVSETITLLAHVWEPYGNSRAAGDQVPRGDEVIYLRIHVRNLLDKTDKTVLLFKEGREKIFEGTSSYRRNLTKLSLLFSHMLWDLKAMFPGGYFHGNTYRVTKIEAQDFWRHSFGNRCIVQWNTFKEQLQRVHPFEEGMESMALKSTIDLTCNDHISVFEFDIFTRLFQPWQSLLRNWNQLAVTHPGYMAFLTYDQVEARLELYLHRPGSYIFRPSCTKMGEWAIGHVTIEGGIVQTIPENTLLHQALIQGFKEGWLGQVHPGLCYITPLCGFFKSCISCVFSYLYPDGRDMNPDLTELCNPSQKDKVKVTEEQYELYCEIGSTFQQCKICAERDKDTRIQPCGHLLCQPCLIGWQKSAGHTCPYCRCDIRGTESVLIEPYLPVKSHFDDEREDDTEEEEDHEDIELIIKELAALRKFSSLDYQVPRSPLAPPLPPKNCTAPPCPTRSSHTQTSETNMLAKNYHSEFAHGGIEARRRHKQPNTKSNRDLFSSEEENFRELRPQLPHPLSHSAAYLQEVKPPPSSQTIVDSGVAWLVQSNPVREGRHNEREERRAGFRKDKYGLGEMTRTMSS
ncbi:E3 ubiquitin-protein ligase CBL-C isoform X2 [Mastacembelus armatus]|uniref:E3 ubiquitin-protein ligase CBL-C isoform X2 n=1 Tax=Mastacembelus armatus TaxID=205130 RepID=UPI000E458694|nr:E3 ubiquitin-protein ligase CBL-like isoform X2 [Mastacembelus armatus]